MNLADIDMKKEFENYNTLAPVKTANINGCEFAYRYYKNPNPEVNVTLLVLAGGTGLADGMFAMAKSFMDKYSLIAFNYPMAFKDNEATADAIYELIKHLKAENVYLWGQSYGGLQVTPPQCKFISGSISCKMWIKRYAPPRFALCRVKI